ncbi:GNAT family N-acetyltransferase [Clostridium sp. MB05]|jgi:[ribosomal protein S5]-alanine N-acetyltransferase
MEIIVKLLEESDLNELLAFEIENKAFFEETLPPRGDEYYEMENFKEIIKELVEEQKNDIVYMYLIKDLKGKVIGRINITSIQRGSFNKAELGYRIGKDYQGKGVATNAAKIVLEKSLKEHKLHRIEAGTSSDNIGSQIVLIKNGFQFVGKYNKYIYQGDKWHDSILFERVLD